MQTSFLQGAHVFNAANKTNLAAAEDMYNGNIASDIIALKNAKKAVFMIQQLANAGGNATITVYACDDVTPTNTAAISFYYKEISGDTQGTITESKAFATSTGENIAYMIEVDADEVREQGYDYVQLICTEKTNAAVDGCIFGFITDLRYSTLSTQIT